MILTPCSKTLQRNGQFPLIQCINMDALKLTTKALNMMLSILNLKRFLTTYISATKYENNLSSKFVYWRFTLHFFPTHYRVVELKGNGHIQPRGFGFNRKLFRRLFKPLLLLLMKLQLFRLPTNWFPRLNVFHHSLIHKIKFLR